MRLFISYARVDRPYCIKIADNLDAHEVWYDDRLYVGQDWWKEIRHRLEWCEGFVYLLSPESVTSTYCRREYRIARDSGRKIFPVLIHNETVLPEELQGIHYADLSHGLTLAAVKDLINAIFQAEREGMTVGRGAATVVRTLAPLNPPALDNEYEQVDLATLVAEAADALEENNYDHAVFLLEQAKSRQHQNRFIKMDMLLKTAKDGLARRTYEREAEVEYRPIAELAKRQATRDAGCEAFQAYQKEYPHYDPDNLARICASGKAQQPFALSLLEWCAVPEGMLILTKPPHLQNGNGNGKTQIQPQLLHMEQFHISKYPVTNAQFHKFIEDSEGYVRDHWWEFSEEAYEWRRRNSHPKPGKFTEDDHPREMVTWFEAMAFCDWLGDKLGLKITLPTDNQWRRAARGSDDRLYPWGNHFDKSLANTSEAKHRRTTSVTTYANARSPFGLFDMAGNVWEWCLNSGTKDSQDREGKDFRTICGGSFIGSKKRAQTNFHFNVAPESNYASIGFRIIALDRNV